MSNYLYLVVGGACLASLTSSRVLGAQGSGAKETPLPAPVFSLADLDAWRRPGQDFFQFANGGWNRANPLPEDYSRWGTFTVARQAQRATDPRHPGGSRRQDRNHGHGQQSDAQIEERKIGDFYASGMNTAAINAAGIEPLRPELDRIHAIDNRPALLKEITHLQMMGVGVLFHFGQMQDFMDSTKVIGAAHQGGLGLPDRDYYLNQDDKSKAVREAYVAHVATMLGLAGENKDKAPGRRGGGPAVRNDARPGLDVADRHAQPAQRLSSHGPGAAQDADAPLWLGRNISRWWTCRTSKASTSRSRSSSRKWISSLTL